jgi:hypothetical protein
MRRRSRRRGGERRRAGQGRAGLRWRVCLGGRDGPRMARILRMARMDEEFEQKVTKYAEGGQRAGASGQRSAVSGQRSAVSGQRSAVSGQRSAVSGQRSVWWTPAPGSPKAIIRMLIWIPGISCNVMRSSPSSSSGRFRQLLRGIELARGGTVLRALRWGLPLFLVLALGCPGQEEPPALTVEPLVIRKWKVPADFMQQLSPVDPFAGEVIGGCVFYYSLPVSFEQQFGIPFPAGTTTRFSPNRGELLVKNTGARLEMIDKLVTSLGTMEMFVLDEALFSPVGTLVLNGGLFPTGLWKQQWHVAPEVMDALIAKSYYEEEVPPDPFAEEKTGPKPKEENPAKDWTIEELFLKNGLEIPPEGSVTYDPATGILTSVNTEATNLYTEMLFLNTAISICKAKRPEGKPAPIPGSDVSRELPEKNQNDPPNRKPPP